MKKLKILCCVLVFIIFCVNSITVIKSQEIPTSGTGGEHITWTYDVETKTLTFTGYGKTGTLSGWYDMHGSVQDCGDWYALREEAEYLVFSEGITEVGKSAFRDFSKLKEIKFSTTIKILDDFAFNGCGIENIVIPTTVKQVGYRTFADTPLKKVIIEEGVEELGMASFASTAIEELTLPKSLKNWSEAVTFSCGKLEKLKFPSNMKILMGDWFTFCPNITNVNLPKSLKHINARAFDGSNLISITIPENVEILGAKNQDCSMFLSCYKLKTVIIKSKKIKKVYGNTFEHFPKKATIYVPNSKKKEYTKMFRKAKLPKKVKIKAIKDMKK